MQQSNQAWIALFRRIPAHLHDVVVLGLRTGTEIVLQKFLRLEPDFMIIRGRVSGTQDAGRVTMVPYSELSFVSLTRMLKDPEVEEIFGKSAPVAGADMPLPPTDNNALPQNETIAETKTPEDATTPAPAAEVNAPKRPDQVSKTLLLAKLRERLKEQK